MNKTTNMIEARKWMGRARPSTVPGIVLEFWSRQTQWNAVQRVKITEIDQTDSACIPLRINEVYSLHFLYL